MLQSNEREKKRKRGSRKINMTPITKGRLGERKGEESSRKERAEAKEGAHAKRAFLLKSPRTGRWTAEFSSVRRVASVTYHPMLQW